MTNRCESEWRSKRLDRPETAFPSFEPAGMPATGGRGPNAARRISTLDCGRGGPHGGCSAARVAAGGVGTFEKGLAMQTIFSIVRSAGKAKSPTPKAHLGTVKLSADMKQILLHIGLRSFVQNENRIEWKPEATWNAGRAAISRTLRRLEERGLVERFNMNGDGKRTTHVELTDAGIEAAVPHVREYLKMLETVNTSHVNHLEDEL
jgi:hypothetical protein